MKSCLSLLIFCGICLPLFLAAPTNDSTVTPAITTKSEHSSIDHQKSFETPKDSSSSASGPKPKTICFEQRTSEGIAFMRCEDAVADSSSGASSSFSSYSSASSRLSPENSRSMPEYRPQSGPVPYRAIKNSYGYGSSSGEQNGYRAPYTAVDGISGSSSNGFGGQSGYSSSSSSQLGGQSAYGQSSQQGYGSGPQSSFGNQAGYGGGASNGQGGSTSSYGSQFGYNSGGSSNKQGGSPTSYGGSAQSGYEGSSSTGYQGGYGGAHSNIDGQSQSGYGHSGTSASGFGKPMPVPAYGNSASGGSYDSAQNSGRPYGGSYGSSSYSPSLKPSFATSYNGGQSGFGYAPPTYPIFSKPSLSHGSTAYGGYSPSHQSRPIYSSSSGGSSYASSRPNLHQPAYPTSRPSYYSGPSSLFGYRSSGFPSDIPSLSYDGSGYRSAITSESAAVDDLSVTRAALGSSSIGPIQTYTYQSIPPSNVECPSSLLVSCKPTVAAIPCSSQPVSYPLPSQAPALDLKFRQKTEDEDVVEGSSSTLAENRQMMNAAVET